MASGRRALLMQKDAERMRRAEKEVGENIPEAMKGLDTEDVGEVGRPRATGAKGGDDATGEGADKTP